MKIFALYIALFLCSNFFGQTSIFISRKDFQIGQQVTLVYQFTFSGDKKELQFEPFVDIIPTNKRVNNSKISSNEKIDLEIISYQDTILSQNNTSTLIAEYKITAWDTGNLVIPPTNLIFQDSIYDFQPLLLSVTMPKLEEGKEIYGIKESFLDIDTFSKTWFKKYWWLCLIPLLLLILGVRYFLKWHKKRGIEKIVNLSLKERTLLALSGLEKEKLWEKNQIKAHYIELSFIFRSYLSEQFQVNFLEKTSYQSALLLAQLNMDKDTIQTIKLILDYSDMVKFAKATPGEYEIMKNMNQVRQIVAETSPIEIAHV